MLLPDLRCRSHGRGAHQWLELWTPVDRYNMYAQMSANAESAKEGSVILVHGLAMSGGYMLPTGAQLSPYWQVFAPDLPGFGRSDKPQRALGISELADVLAQWMDRNGLSQASLIGNSYGCQIIVEFALRHPDRIDRAVLVGPTVDPQGCSAFQQVTRTIIDGLLYEPPSLYPIVLHDYLRAGMQRTWQSLLHMLSDPIAYKLTQVKISTLVVRGANDLIVPQRWAEEAVQLLPYGQLIVFPGAAHAVNFSAAARLGKTIRQFLQ